MRTAPLAVAYIVTTVAIALAQLAIALAQLATETSIGVVVILPLMIGGFLGVVVHAFQRIPMLRKLATGIMPEKDKKRLTALAEAGIITGIAGMSTGVATMRSQWEPMNATGETLAYIMYALVVVLWLLVVYHWFRFVKPTINVPRELGRMLGRVLSRFMRK